MMKERKIQQVKGLETQAPETNRAAEKTHPCI